MRSSRERRLSAFTLGEAQARLVPDYSRNEAPVIAHLGVGAFARAHLAVYADQLLRRGQPALIRGVSLRSRMAQDQLEPQDGLFTVAVREPDEEPSLQVVGAMARAETGPAAALEAMAAPTTALVTLTITEKGYAASADPMSAPALIAQALHRRRQAGLAPPVFASLDNLLDNGATLRARVLDAADRIDPALGSWIATAVAFPNSVVDRMSPAPTEADRDDIAQNLGLRDEAAVVAERHRSWITQRVAGLEPWGEVGVELVEDVVPFERRKLWLLNGPHSAVAYAGLLRGHTTIAAAVTDAAIARFVRTLVAATLDVAELPAALQPALFAEEALRRFANPALGHTCAQVGADGSSKLPQRLLPIVAARADQFLDTTGFAKVAAVWIAATAGVTVRGTTLPALEDPMADALHAAALRRNLADLTRVALGDTLFATEVATMLERLTTEGPGLLEVGR